MSATSGRGLTSPQVAAAIKCVAAAHVEPEGQEQRIRRTKSGVKESYYDLEDSLFKEEKEYSIDVDGVTVSVVEYAPRVFHFIRQIEAVEDPFFADEWDLPKEKVSLDLGEGRSQALFLKSKHMEFMAKTIAPGEATVLLKVLKTYGTHIAQFPNSFLMRFYLLVKIQVGKEIGYLLCFGDVFGNASSLNEKWDIKGRVPKPGKYRSYPHLIRRAYEPDPHLISTPREHQRKGDVESPDEEMEVEAQDKTHIPTQKDKDLTRLFWVESPLRDRVVEQLQSDYTWLEKAGLMDYSLLIGVTYKEGKQSRRGKPYIIKSMRPVGLEEGATPPEEKRPCIGHSRPSGFKPLSEFADGILSLNDQEIYYIGVIDMLTQYGFNKKVANFCKGFLWKDETLSTIPPSKYKKRISEFTELIFPSVVP